MIDFDATYAEHASRLLAATVKQLDGDLQTAADIMANVWAKAWERRSTFDPARGSVGAWLNCIRRSAIVDHYRTKRETMPLVAEPAAQTPKTFDGVVEAIDKLPEPWAVAIRLVYLDDRSFPSAAEALGVSVGCVHRRAVLGLQRLRTILAA